MSKQNVTRFCARQDLEDLNNLQQLFGFGDNVKMNADRFGVAIKDVRVSYNEDDSADSRGVIEVAVCTPETDEEYRVRLEKQSQHDERVMLENEEADRRLYHKLKLKFENKE